MSSTKSKTDRAPQQAEELERRRTELENELGEPITVDGLTATWSIFQRRRGHRHSTDDLLTGWYALNQLERRGMNGLVDRTLDLGAGIGGVGLLVLFGLLTADEHRPAVAQAVLTSIEAQEISFRFLKENIRANGLEDRVHPILGDLRELALEERFPLITGSPPYFDVSAGIVPSDPQKAHARFELRGDVRDYARAAKRHLLPQSSVIDASAHENANANVKAQHADNDDKPCGLFVFCFPWQQKARAVSAVRSEGFRILSSRDVIPREGLSPLFSLFSCALVGEEHEEAKEEEPFVVRSENGVHTPAMRAVRARFGWPVEDV